MANKKQTAEQVKNVLGVGYFESSRTVQDNDPIEAISMKVEIDKVQKYDRNPRKSRNPEYNTLLELLRANGQEEALTITRRPGDEKYIIRRGGNTRLEIMSMLYHETGDQRFGIIDCLFMPWTSESDCIVGHLNENTSQGRMTLIDKARGYRQFKLEYEKEHGVEALGQRKLADLLKEKGSSINTSLLGIMNYALDVLEPAIPETLERGLGKPQIEKLKRIDQTFQRLAEAHHLYDQETSKEKIQSEFHNLLSDHDGDEWDMGLVLHEFYQRLGGLLHQIPYSRLKFDIDECLKCDPWKVDLTSTLKDNPAPIIEHKQAIHRAPTAQRAKEPKKEETVLQPAPANENPISQESQQTSLPPPVMMTPVAERQLSLPESAFTEGKLDLKSMRARIYILALQFAKSTRVQDCLLNWNAGYGYFMDLPRTKLLTAMAPEQSNLNWEYQTITNRLAKDRDEVSRALSWWLLWQAQGIIDHTTECSIPGFQLMPECLMKTLISQLYDPDNTSNRLMTSAATKMQLHLGGYEHPVDLSLAYTYIKPANVMKYIALLEARTQLQAYVEEHQINLWKEI